MRVGVQPLQDIDEVNMFKDDNTVVHFRKPLSKYLSLVTAQFLTLCSYSPVLSQRELDGCDRQPRDQRAEGDDA